MPSHLRMYCVESCESKLPVPNCAVTYNLVLFKYYQADDGYSVFLGS